MKKALISASVVVAFALYCVHAHDEQSEAPKVAPISQSAKSTNTATQTATTASTSQSTGQFKDGTYTGTSADAYYGYIQVKATISGGKLTDVTFLDYPSDRRESIEINSQAMPMLKQEAIQAQTAHVDGVSGATDTSAAFIESLQAALNQAKS
jgi:uncharacterized protein with FMN-binding domain